MAINKWDSTSISMSSGFSVLGKKPNFSRDLFENLEQMVSCPAMYLPDAFHAQIVAPFMDPDDPETELFPAGQMFDFVRDREDDPILGKWRPLAGGSGAIDDSSKTRTDASWSCKKLWGLIGDFDNVKMNALHDKLNPDFNSVSCPTEPDYDPDNPSYHHGVSDPSSSGYNTTSLDYDPISDYENTENNIRPDGTDAVLPYYDPTSEFYNGIVDPFSPLYDPDNPNYDATKDSSSPSYIQGSNEKYIEVYDRVEDINEAVNILNRESASRVVLTTATNSLHQGSTPYPNMLFEDREGRRVAILYNTGLNPDIVMDYDEPDPDTGEQEVTIYTYEQARNLPHVGMTHTLDSHIDIQDDYFDNYNDFKKWVEGTGTGNFSEAHPYVWSGSAYDVEGLYSVLIDKIETAGFDISEPLLGYQVVKDGPVIPKGLQDPMFDNTGDDIWLVLGHYITVDNPDYSFVSDPTTDQYDTTSDEYVSFKDSSNIKNQKRADDTDAVPPYYIPGSNEPTKQQLVAQFPKIEYSLEDFPEGRWVNTYVRPDSMVLRWNAKVGKWLIQKDSLDASKEYTDKQIRLAINGQAYVTNSEPIFHSATLDPVTGEIIDEAFVEYTDADDVIKVGVVEARYYWSTTDPTTGEDKTYVYLWMDETGTQQEEDGSWLILDAADVNFTQFWSKEIDTVDDYWWKDESRIRHTHQDDDDETKKTTILSLYGTEKAIEDWTIDSLTKEKTKDVNDHPLSANQGYTLDQIKEERMQFNNVEGTYDLRVPEACEELDGKIIWYYGELKKASVSWEHAPNGVYNNIHDFAEYFWNYISHKYPAYKNVEIKKALEEGMTTVEDRDGVLTPVTHIFSPTGDVSWKSTAGDFDNPINLGVASESIYEVLEFANKLIITYDDPAFDPDNPPEDWHKGDPVPRIDETIEVLLRRTLLDDMEPENFYRCTSALDEDLNTLWFWKKVELGGDAYETKYISTYCQSAQPNDDFIDGTRNIKDVGTALDKIYYELWGVQTQIKKFALTYGYAEPDGTIKEATHNFLKGDLALEPGQTILPTYTYNGEEKRTKLTWEYSKPLQSEAPSSTDVIQFQYLFIDGGQKIIGNNKSYNAPDSGWAIGTTFRLKAIDSGGYTVEAQFSIGEGGYMYYGDLPHRYVYDFNNGYIEPEEVWEYIQTQPKVFKVSKAGTYTPNAESGHTFFAYPASWGDIVGISTYPVLKESGKPSAFWDIHTLDYYNPSGPAEFNVVNEYGVTVKYYIAYSTQLKLGDRFTWILDSQLVKDTVTGELYENEFVKQHQDPSNEGKVLMIAEDGNVVCEDLENIECNIKKLPVLPTPDGSMEGDLVQYLGATVGEYTHNLIYTCSYVESVGEYRWVSTATGDIDTKIANGIKNYVESAEFRTLIKDILKDAGILTEFD